jgi:alkylation response protein AidB-like acyl-CoA dehydrogenase
VPTPQGKKGKNELLRDLLTPVAKTYPSEMGVLSVSQGLQILGGYGYCDEFSLELFYRYELPKFLGLAGRLMEGDGLTVEMKTGLFEYLNKNKVQRQTPGTCLCLHPYTDPGIPNRSLTIAALKTTWRP